MKSSVLLRSLILFDFYFCAKCSAKPLSTLAINSIIREYFSREFPRVDIVHFSHNQTNISGINVDEILRDESCLIAIKLITVKSNVLINWKLNTSSVIIFDSMITFFENM